MGKAFLAARAEDMPIADRMQLVDTILSVIEAPDLQQLFAAGSKAEVPVAGKVHHAGRQIDVVGQIDRIAESATEVLIADFKTGEPQELDATPQAYLVQMALYRAALAPLWPQKRLRMMLIWTYGPKIVELTDVVLHQALATLERQIPPAA
jgi:ATP-dependent helicase/nuclease subunit A